MDVRVWRIASQHAADFRFPRDQISPNMQPNNIAGHPPSIVSCLLCPSTMTEYRLPPRLASRVPTDAGPSVPFPSRRVVSAAAPLAPSRTTSRPYSNDKYATVDSPAAKDWERERRERERGEREREREREERRERERKEQQRQEQQRQEQQRQERERAQTEPNKEPEKDKEGKKSKREHTRPPQVIVDKTTGATYRRVGFLGEVGGVVPRLL